MAKDNLQYDLTGFPAFAPNFSAVAVQRRAFCRMEVPGLGPLRRQREDTRKAACPFWYGNGGIQARTVWIVPTAIAGWLRHELSDLFEGFQKAVQRMPVIENAPANTGERNIRAFPDPGLIQEID